MHKIKEQVIQQDDSLDEQLIVQKDQSPQTTDSPQEQAVLSKSHSREKKFQTCSFEQYKSESLTNLFWNTNNQHIEKTKIKILHSKKNRQITNISVDYDEIQRIEIEKSNVDQSDESDQENNNIIRKQDSFQSLARDSSRGSILYDTQEEKTVKKTSFISKIKRMKSYSSTNDSKEIKSQFQLSCKENSEIESSVQVEEEIIVQAEKKTLWQKFEDYIWLENHQYFYICTIHDYCWNNGLIKSSRSLIIVRSILCFIMFSLVISEIFADEGFRWKYFTNWGVYLTFIVTILQLTCSIKYKYSIDNFTLQIQNLSQQLDSNNRLSLESLTGSGTDEEKQNTQKRKLQINLQDSKNESDKSESKRDDEKKFELKSKLLNMFQQSPKIESSKEYENRINNSGLITNIIQDESTNDDEQITKVDSNLLLNSDSSESNQLKKSMSVDSLHQQNSSEKISISKDEIVKQNFANIINKLDNMLENYQNDEFEGTNPIQNIEVMLENQKIEPNDKQLLSKKNENKYHIFHLYKWASIMFQMTMLFELIIVPIFWTVILPGILATRHYHKNEEAPTMLFIIVGGYCDHLVPLIVLLVDFSFNCIPFIWRHFWVSMGVCLIYSIFNMVYSLKIAQIYPVIDYKSTLGIIVPFSIFIYIFFANWLLVFCSVKKLQRANKNQALEQFNKIKEQLKLKQQSKKCSDSSKGSKK